VLLYIVVPVAAAQWLPGPVQAIGTMEIAKVNLPVGLLIWVMIIPMLLKVDFGALHQVKQHWRGIGVTLFVNWAVKPFSMALLGWIFIRHLFAPFLPAAQIDSYFAGLILLAAAPCTAMVFVWSRLTNGDPYFTLSQVALNDVIMVFAFAPVVALLLGVSSISVPWETLLASVALYIVVPVLLAQAIRRLLRQRGQGALDAALQRTQPWSIAARSCIARAGPGWPCGASTTPGATPPIRPLSSGHRSARGWRLHSLPETLATSRPFSAARIPRQPIRGWAGPLRPRLSARRSLRG
jgi:ACR3 family arsenite transporter